MGSLAEEHEQNIEGGAMRKVLIKDFDTLQKDCGGFTTFGDLMPPKGYEKSFVPRMRPLCGCEVTVSANGWVQGLADFQNMRFESWMYEELEVPDPSADERLQQNEEHLRKMVEPRMGSCLSCGEIKVLDMEGSMGMCRRCLPPSRTINVHHDYKKLCDVLVAALDQAQSGKGRERHAAGEPFEQQEICQNTRAVGYGYPLGQARKKARESLRLLEDRGPEAAIAECLGAINYLAAAVVVMQEKGGDA